MIYTALLLGACWGSVLNMIAWRLLSGQSVWYYRSYCPACHTHIRWYDLVPIVSWIILRGHCRTCNASISPIYPIIETVTAITAALSVAFLDPTDLVWYWPFASTLIITIHTDLRAHRIASWITIWLIPIAIAAAWYHVTPISWQESVFAASVMYFIFAGINTIFWYIKGMHTLGQGDWELMAYIASVIGYAAGVYTMFGGSLITLIYAVCMTRNDTQIHNTPLAFGAGLACAALITPFIMLY